MKIVSNPAMSYKSINCCCMKYMYVTNLKISGIYIVHVHVHVHVPLHMANTGKMYVCHVNMLYLLSNISIPLLISVGLVLPSSKVIVWVR